MTENTGVKDPNLPIFQPEVTADRSIMPEPDPESQQEFISGENLYFEYKGHTKVEVELNALDDDYPISRVIKQDTNGDVIVQGMEDQTYQHHQGITRERGSFVSDNFHHELRHNSSGSSRGHSHISGHPHHHMDAVTRQSDIIRDQINRSMNKNLLCDFEYADDLEAMKEFWLGLSVKDKKTICQIESSEVMKVIQEDPKASCSCRVCGNRKVTLEKELQKLYVGYYSVRKLASESLDECELNISLVNNIFGIPNEISEEPPKASPENPVESIMSVADDLVKNNGENFINLIEQLQNSTRNQPEGCHDLDPTQLHNLFQNPPEPAHFDNFTRASQVEELGEEEPFEQVPQEEYDDGDAEDYEDDLEDEDYEFDSQYQNETDQVTRKRLEETYKMLQLITSRVLRIKVYEAYKAKKADDVSKSLLDEFAKEEAELKEKEERHRKRKEKEKERKRLQRLAKEEEKKRIEEEALEKQRKEEEERRKKMEENRQRKEAERKKREEEKRCREEEKKKKKAAQLEKQRLEKEERDLKKKERQEEQRLKQEKEKEAKTKRAIEIPKGPKKLQQAAEAAVATENAAQITETAPIVPSVLSAPNMPGMPIQSSSQLQSMPSIPSMPTLGTLPTMSGNSVPSATCMPPSQSSFDQNAMLSNLMNTLPQPPYPFLPQSQLGANTNWFGSAGFANSPMLYDTNLGQSLGSNLAPQMASNLSPVPAPVANQSSPFLNELLSPPTPSRPSTSSMDMYPGTDIWSSGRSPSVTGAIDMSPIKDIGMSSRQGSIWGSTTGAPAPVSWDANQLTPLITELVQREAINASLKLPLLPGGGHALVLMYRWVKQIVEASYANLTLSQFVSALQTDMSLKVHATFRITRGATLDDAIVTIMQDSLGAFSNLSLMDGLGGQIPSGGGSPMTSMGGSFTTGNTLPRTWTTQL